MSASARFAAAGGEIAYRLDGPEPAPVLLLSNSLGTDLSMWDPQMVALSAHFRVLRYDQRGHGASKAPPGPYSVADLGGDVIGLLDHLGIGRASVLGLSLGGMVGMWLAARHPERVERLVLACTATELPPASAWTERAATVRAGGTAAIVETLLGRWFTDRFRHESPLVASAFAAMISACSDEGYASCCEAIATFDGRPLLGRIEAPTLVIAGSEDPVTTPASALELETGIPGAGLHVIAGTSHIANVGRPEEFTAAVLGHLAGTAYDRGIAMRSAVLGGDYVAAKTQGAQEPGAFASFQRFITESAWGSVWSAPRLEVRTRRLVTLALLAAHGHLAEFELHARAALESEGADRLEAEEIGEVLIHTAVYAGVPAANAAFSRLNAIVATPGRPQ